MGVQPVTLVIDTALSKGQLAFMEGESCLAHVRWDSVQGHAEQLLAALEPARAAAGIAWASLARVVVTTGPGIFTGIRVGLACARALKLAYGMPVVGVSTLTALSHHAQGGPVTALIDARKGEAYAQDFSKPGEALSPPRLLNVAELTAVAGRKTPCIAAPLPFAQAFGWPGADALDINHMLKAACASEEKLLPLYVRKPDAVMLKERA